MTSFPIESVLVANRGEIAARIFRTSRRLGISTIAVAPPDDRDAYHTRLADDVREIGSYLADDDIIRAAVAADARAIHPGYGFLSENARFASAVFDAGLVWVGPAPETLERVADKIDARAIARSCGIPTVESGPATELGFPLMIKAAAGGGGRGMRVVDSSDQLGESVDAARREAKAAFGDDRLYFERYLPRPRHVEVQILGDQSGTVVHLGERDCSIQRRHQKVLEESPAPELDEALRRQITESALALARAVGYVNAGTVEFLIDDDRAFFLEVNARIQVEHPVTELVTGVDLIEQQFLTAAGHPLTAQSSEPVGHAIEVRIYAEDPTTFLPQIGVVDRLILPSGIRVDAGIEEGDRISLTYDAMIAKLIAHGVNRETALSQLVGALEATQIKGPVNNLAFLRWLANHPDIAAGTATTRFLAEHAPLSKYRRSTFPWNVYWRLGGSPTQRAARLPKEEDLRADGADGSVVERSAVVAPMPGTVLRLLVEEGESVMPRQPLIILEAMKMETPLPSPYAARVSAVEVAEGEQVDSGTVLIRLEE